MNTIEVKMERFLTMGTAATTPRIKMFRLPRPKISFFTSLDPNFCTQSYRMWKETLTKDFTGQN